MDELGQARLRAFGQRWLMILIFVTLPLVTMANPTPHQLVAGLGQAQVALRHGQPAAAAESLAQAIRWSPDHLGLRLKAASLAVDTGQAQIVRRALDHPALANSTAGGCLGLQGSILDAEPSAALEILEQLPASCPPPVAATQALADKALQAGQIETSLSLYQTLSRVQPDDLTLQRTIALLLSLSTPSEAAGRLRQYQREAETQDLLITDLIGTIERASAVGEPAFTYAQIGQVFLQHQKWLEASLAFDQSLKSDPDYFEARAYYGLALDQLGKHEQAKDEIEKAQRQAPSEPLPAYLLSRFWLNAEQAAPAQRYARIARLAEPSNPAYTAQLASAYAASGDLQKAEELYLEAVQLSGAQAEFLGLLADFYLRNEIDLASGVRTARRAYMLNPSALNTGRLGYAHYLAGDLRLAERFLQSATRLDPTLASAHFHYGLVLIELGAGKDAADEWRQAVELDPTGQWGTLAARALARFE